MSERDPEPQPIAEAETLLIPWPKVRPFGFKVTAEMLKEAWDAVVPSFGEHGTITQSGEERIIMGVLRAVYDGMHGLTEKPHPVADPRGEEG